MEDPPPIRVRGSFPAEHNTIEKRVTYLFDKAKSLPLECDAVKEVFAALDIGKMRVECENVVAFSIKSALYESIIVISQRG